MFQNNGHKLEILAYVSSTGLKFWELILYFSVSEVSKVCIKLKEYISHVCNIK